MEEYFHFYTEVKNEKIYRLEFLRKIIEKILLDIYPRIGYLGGSNHPTCSEFYGPKVAE